MLLVPHRVQELSLYFPAKLHFLHLPPVNVQLRPSVVENKETLLQMV